MDWQKELDELKRRESSPSGSADPSASSASTTRDATHPERIARLVAPRQPSTARKIAGPGVLRRAQRPRGPDAVQFILGRAKVEGARRVRGDDFTVRAARPTRNHQGQAQHVRRMANDAGCR